MAADGCHVLIIEDEPIIALELEALLSDMGFRSFAFADCPADALAHAIGRKPDLITADYRILCGTGLEAVHLIEEAIGQVPVVYVTGNPDALLVENAPIIVDKPILPAALAAACAHACKRQQPPRTRTGCAR